MDGGGPEVVLRGSGCRLGCREQPMQPVELRIVFALCVCIVANVRACFSGSARMLCCVTHAHARNTLRVERECARGGGGGVACAGTGDLGNCTFSPQAREETRALLVFGFGVRNTDRASVFGA